MSVVEVEAGIETVRVTVNFTLDINPVAWTDEKAVAIDRIAAERIDAEVRAHAESIVRDLFHDQGWTNES